MNRRVITAAVVGLVATLAACSAIIGTRDLSLEPGIDGGNPSVDGSSPVLDGTVGKDAPVATKDGAGNDGAQPDGGSPEAASCNGVNLQSDPKNCGTCGHDCLGGACAPMVDGGAGVCQPVALVAALPVGLQGIGLSSTSVYWANYDSSQITKCLKDGGGVTVLAQYSADGGQVSSPGDVVTDEAYVYWSNFLGSSADPTADVGRIARCPLAGCGDAGPQLLVNNINYPTGMAVDEAGVYWGNSYDQLVARWSKADGGVRVFAAGLGALQAVAVDPSFVYWSTNGDLDRADKDAGGPEGGPYTTLYNPSSAIYATGIAVDATNLYFVQRTSVTDGLVAFIPKDGVGTGVPTKLATSLPFPFSITVDGTNVYWVNQGPDTGNPNGAGSIFVSGSVMTCPKTGCPSDGPTVLAQNQAWPLHIAVDDKAVYWTDHGNNVSDGAVMMVAK